MKKISLLFFVLAILISASAQTYPYTKTVDSSDTYFGITYKDPYRWMENLKDTNVVNWFKTQQQFTDSLFTNTNGVDSFINQLSEYNTSKTWGRGQVLKTKGGIYFGKGGRNQLDAALYYKANNDTTEHLIFNAWKINPGIRYNLAALKFSPDENYFFAALDQNGEEYPFIKVYDCKNKEWLKDSIPHCWGNTIMWAADGKGFIYGYNTSEDRTSAEASNFDVVKYHTLSTNYTADITIMDNKIRNEVEHKISNSYYAAVYTNDSKSRLYCQPNQGFEFEYKNVYYSPAATINKVSKKWELLFPGLDSVYLIDNVIETDKNYYFISAKGKGFKSLRRTTFLHPDFANAKIILPEDVIWQLENMVETKSYIIVSYSKYGFLNKTVFIDKKTGVVNKTTAIDKYDRYIIQSIGTKTDECLLRINAINRPTQTLRYDIANNKLINDSFWAAQNQTILTGWEDIVSETIEVPSYDGTLVPLTIMRNKNTILDGNNVCLINGYGAYGIATKDNSFNTYSPVYSLLMQRGVILAHAYVRGGGEKGEAWHIAGMKENKPNTWKDFIACAEYLVKNKYTQPAKFGCTGGSAGGILIGRAITERPDLFAAAHIQSGSLNTIRAKAWANTIGNYPEYGNPDIESEMKGLIEMDALAHVKPGVKYPAIYITTGINDTRVPPWSPAKFAAAMQASSTSGKPVLLHTNFEGGHFGNANATSMNDLLKTQLKDVFFLLWQCGHKDFQVK